MAELELAQLKILHKELKHAIQEEKIEKANAINLLQQRLLEEQTKQLEQINTTPIQKQLAMNSSQPQFNGNKSENINDWINITTTNLTNAHIPLTEWVSLASSYLRTNALQMYNVLRVTNPTWNQFIEALKTEFLPPNYAIIVYDQLRNLTYKSDIQEYNSKFNYLISQIQFDEEIFKTLIYRDNCAEDTKNHLAYKNPKTLKEAQQLAIAFETHLKKKTYDPTISSFNITQKSHTNKYDKFCSNCKRNNHSTEECFNKKLKEKQKQQISTTNLQSKPTCTYCKKTNHTIDKCFKKQNKDKNSNTPFDSSNSTIKAHKNNIHGLTINIHSIHEIEQQPLITSYASINNKQFPVIFDTAASHSILIHHIAIKYNITYNTCDNQCTLGD